MQATPVLLAAGASERFGSEKLLHPLKDGTPVVLASARALVRALGPILAVVRAPDSGVARCLEAEAGVELVSCPGARLGMGKSIACGVGRATGAAGWIIALGDMPYIRGGTLRRVAERLAEGAWIVAPVYRGRRGHPVGFCARFREELLELGTDYGARHLLSANPDLVSSVVVDDAGVIRDIDTPADLI